MLTNNIIKFALCNLLCRVAIVSLSGSASCVHSSRSQAPLTSGSASIRPSPVEAEVVPKEGIASQESAHSLSPLSSVCGGDSAQTQKTPCHLPEPQPSISSEKTNE